MQETPDNTLLTKTPPKKISTIGLILTVTFRILGVRNRKVNDTDLGHLSGMQVGYACALALLTFTAIIAGLSVLAAKLMG